MKKSATYIKTKYFIIPKFKNIILADNTSCYNNNNFQNNRAVISPETKYLIRATKSTIITIAERNKLYKQPIF